MRVAVFSDVHGNLIALERFISATRLTVDAYLCLGDVVDYGPWNDECLERICQLPGIVLLEGNHERLFLGTEDLAHEIPLVQTFYRHSRAFFSRFDLIGGLPQQVRMDGFECVHTIDGRSLYPDTEVVVADNYLVGHSHHQFQVARSGFALVNPGSVGQNRKWINRVDYAILDTDTGKVQLLSSPYDVDLFLSELRVRKYPESCINYYSGKPRVTGIP